MIDCRVCGGLQLAGVLDLGMMPLANALPVPESDLSAERRFPLRLVRCEACDHVQLDYAVPPQELFADYVYFSSYSDTVVHHAAACVEDLVSRRRLGASSSIVEVASNDGYLLQHYARRGISVLGIEPAANVAAEAKARGIPTRVEFFDADTGRRLAAEGVTADVLHGHNVFAHVSSPASFLAGAVSMLRSTGVVVLEVPYLRDMIEHGEFDTIYHEHLSYYALADFERLFAGAGLRVIRAERTAIHGGSIRVTGALDSANEQPDDATMALLEEERAWRVNLSQELERFRSLADDVRAELPALLRRLQADGKRIAAYGAAAKGSTLLNWCGAGVDLIDFVVDRNPVKQGRLMPGVHLPILPTEALVEKMPAFALLLAWNHASEIAQQQRAYAAQGGQFIIPVPNPRVV